MWEMRELCAPIFARIWDVAPEDLLTSFDGTSFQRFSNRSKYEHWMHVDQNRSLTDFTCVQGAVNLLPNKEKDGGLIVIEGSHNLFNDYMESRPSEGITGWTSIDMNNPIISELPIVKICANAGDIILWDSRTFHCGFYPLEGHGPRMCIYVSQQPRDRASKKTLDKRIEYFEGLKMTNHWCYDPHMTSGFYIRSYGKAVVKPLHDVEMPDLNPLCRRLVGYDD
jgi:Phytanoyl-CoA dioxygenase (PhyH)